MLLTTSSLVLLCALAGSGTCIPVPGGRQPTVPPLNDLLTRGHNIAEYARSINDGSLEPAGVTISSTHKRSEVQYEDSADNGTLEPVGVSTSSTH